MSRTKKPLIAKPAPSPPPPATRADVERYVLEYLTHEVANRTEVVERGKRLITSASSPALLVHELEWSSKFIENATELAVYTKALEALTAPDTKATVESVLAFATREALTKARSGANSTSAISNLVETATCAAWASLALALAGWCEAIKRADETAAATPAA